MSAKNLTAEIIESFEKGEFDKFIHEVNFPKFKNFVPGEKLEFRYPITAIVGPNGGGKSSVLHALWGMTKGYSTSRFWFSTPVDPILEEVGEQNRYWYKHFIKDLNNIAQCRKISGNKRSGYWEPSRPNQKEGMEKMPPLTDQNSIYISKSGDRWNQVDRTPTYINSKAGSSSFERYFYQADELSLGKKHGDFLKYSAKLRHTIDNKLSYFSYYSKRRVFKNFQVSEQAIKHINSILGKKYQTAQCIEHDLYGKIRSSSVIFSTKKLNYSECFAGSGEHAIVNTVLTIENLKEFDLLLLDEPETSLHPGAQKKFINYLNKVVNSKKIQVVISTHSPTIIENLPEKALIALEDTYEGVRVRKHTTKQLAFNSLGYPNPEKITLLAEDALLASIADRAKFRLPKELRSMIEIVPAACGASEMLTNQVKAYSKPNLKVIMILDGDMLPAKKEFDKDYSQIDQAELEEILNRLKRIHITMFKTREQIIEWSSWCKEHIILIDALCAEKVLLMCIDPDNQKLKDTATTNKQFKNEVHRYLQKKRLKTDSTYQADVLKTHLETSPKDSEQLKILNELTNDILHKIDLIRNK